MRKHNEGYTLVLVMVVLAVLSVLATVILTAAERNLDAHKHGVQYMQNKYQAQGEIEKFLGELESFNGSLELTEVTEGSWQLTYDEEKELIFISSICNEVRIDCTILIDGGIDNFGTITGLTGYTYTSYKISTDGGAA